jgi:WD40 repeat protein
VAVLVVVAVVSSLATHFLAGLFGWGAARRLAAQLQQTRREFAEQAEATQQLERAHYKSLVSEIQAVRVFRVPGWRWYALERLHEAATLSAAASDPVALRSTALEILVEPDVLSLAALKGHREPIRSVAFSPDGDHVATGSADGTIRFWHVHSGKLVRTLELGSPVRSLAFDPRAPALIASADDGVVRVWRIDEWSEPRELASDAGRTTILAISPDGSTLATAVDDGSILLRHVDPSLARRANVDSDETIERLSGAGPVSCLAWSPDGRQLASASGNLLRVWDVPTGAEREPCVGHTAAITAVAFRPDGSSIVSVAGDATLRVWDADTSTPLAVWSTSGGPAASVAVRPDVSAAAIGSTDGGLRLLDLVTGEERLLVREHSGPVTAVAFSPDGSTLVSGSIDASARLYSVAVGSDRVRYRAHTADVQSLDFAPTGRWLASGSAYGSLALYPAPGELPDRWHAGGTVLAAAYSPDGKQLAVGCKERNVVVVWDLASGQVRRVFWGHAGGVLAVAWSRDGRTVASGSEDGTVRLWDATSGAAGPVLRGHAGTVNSVAFNPDGGYLVSGSFDRTVRVWPVSETGAPADPITVGEHDGYVLSVAWSADGRTLASAGADHVIKLWELPDGARARATTSRSSAAARRIRVRELGLLVGHTSHVYSVAFSADGTRLISGSNDRTMRIWDVPGRRSLAIVPAHSAKVLAVACDPRGELVASSAEDGSVRVWSLRGLRASPNPDRDRSENAAGVVPDLELWASLQGHSLGVPALKFSPDGEDLLTGSWDRTVRLWAVRAIDRTSFASPSTTPASDLPTEQSVPSRIVRPRRVLAGRTASASTDPRPATPIRLARGTGFQPVGTDNGRLEAYPTGVPDTHMGAVNSVAFLPDGNGLVFASSGEAVRFCDLDEPVGSQGGAVTTVTAGIPIASGSCVVLRGSRRTVLVGQESTGTLTVRDAQSGERNVFLAGAESPITSLAASPNSPVLATGHLDGTIRIYNLPANSAATSDSEPQPADHTIAAHPAPVRSLAFAPNGDLLASASGDSSVKLWTVRDGASSGDIVSGTGFVSALAFSPRGDLLAIGRVDGAVQLWEPTRHQLLTELPNEGRAVRTMAFTTDGRFLAIGDSGPDITLWNLGALRGQLLELGLDW